jgi:hypothetical protein
MKKKREFNIFVSSFLLFFWAHQHRTANTLKMRAILATDTGLIKGAHHLTTPCGHFNEHKFCLLLTTHHCLGTEVGASTSTVNQY